MALVKAATEVLGLSQLAEGWGLHLEAAVFVDSSAALAVTNRRGCGRLRHVRIGHLWVQEAAQAETVSFRKVAGTHNPADLLTKYLVAQKAEQCTARISQTVRCGSAQRRLELSSLVGQLGHEGPMDRGGVKEESYNSDLVSTDRNVLLGRPRAHAS